MNLSLATPFNFKYQDVKPEVLRLFIHEKEGRYSDQMGDFWSDLGDSLWGGVCGLADAISGAVTAVVHTVEQIGETIALIVRASIGDVSWNEVLGSIGKVFQDIGTVLVIINPTRIVFDWLSTASLTAHAFHELDKFTGGMITDVKNISTLVGRAMRGDPITKQELLKDAMLIITIIAIVFTGGGYVAVGMLVGSMIGREVCKHQTEYQGACTAAFMIAGAAVGAWGNALTGTTGGFVGGDGISSAEQEAWLQGDEAYSAYLDNQAALASTSLVDHLSIGAKNFLTGQGVSVISQGAINLCQKQGWAGKHECEILGQVTQDYLTSGTDKDWTEFLTDEIAKIGAQEIMLQWFPEHSKEHQAIARKWSIKYIDGPGGVETVVTKKTNPMTWIMLAAGTAVMLGAT